MPYFDLDPETATIHDLWGCLTFPDDPVSAQKYAIREQIIWHGMIVADVARNENIARALKEIKKNNPECPDWDPKKAEEDFWQHFKDDIEQYGGLPAMASLVTDSDFFRKVKHADAEQAIVAFGFFKAWEIDNQGLKVSKEKVFRLIEEAVRFGRLDDRRGEPLEIPASRNTQFKAWRRYGSVAHWIAAAFALLGQKEMAEEEFGDAPSELDPYAPDNIKTFGSLAERFLEIASRIMVRSQTGDPQPFLDPEKAWVLPPSFPRAALPPQRQLRLPFPTLEQWEMDIIKPSRKPVF